MYDDTPLCSSLRDEVLERLTSCNIFETETLKDDYYEHEEGIYISGCDTSKEDSLISDIDGSDDYWNFIDNPTCENLIENPIHDMSSKGSVNTWENLSMEEENPHFSCDHSKSYHAEPHKGISNEDIEKQCCENSDVMQSVEY